MNRLSFFMSVLLVAGLSQFDFAYSQGSTPARTLHDAAAAGDTSEITALLEKGADVDQKNSRTGWTPLFTAMLNGQFAAAELLVSKGANPEARDNRGESVLGMAVKAGQKNLVELLVAKGADVNGMSGPGDNALSLAKKSGQTEIADFLVKKGAKEPNLQDMDGAYYGRPSGDAPTEVMPQGPAAAPVTVDLLADPNEIKARVKTFPGLEKLLKDTGDQSSNEMRQWEQKRYDNRTLLVRAIQKQFDDELGLVKKIAVEEKAKKTSDAIDSVLARKKERSDAVYKELTQQKREEKAAMSSQVVRGGRPTRGRATAGRNTTGYDNQGTSGGAYSDTGDGSPYGRPGAAAVRGKPEEQLDRETEEEIRTWTGANFEKKEELAKSVQTQITADVAAIRVIAEQEKAKKTVAALDGLLLARQERLDSYLKKMQEEELKAQQQAQDPRFAGRTAGRYAPGTQQTAPGAPTQQGRPTRGRRR